MTPQCKVRNAVVPVAGLGTRLLPATKSQPKEMLPVGRKPVVQYVVEELVRAGAGRILFVTGKNKTSIEDHFDVDNELIRNLREVGKEDLLRELEFERMDVHFLYTRQRSPKGLGDAVLYAEHFAGDEPFFVALGDSILGEKPSSCILKKMASVFFEKNAISVVAFEEVLEDDVSSYGIAKVLGDGEVFQVADLIEKPSRAEAPSNLAIAGRYVFSHRIFEAVRRTKPDKNGEIQLTDAMRILLSEGEKIYGVRLGPGEKRYDIGNFESYLNAFVEFAMNDPDYGNSVKEKIRKALNANYKD